MARLCPAQTTRAPGPGLLSRVRPGPSAACGTGASGLRTPAGIGRVPRDAFGTAHRQTRTIASARPIRAAPTVPIGAGR